MSEHVDAVEVIGTKRDGRRMSEHQIRWMFEHYLAGVVSEEQMASLLMAIVWRGMDDGELADWTEAMVRSGDRLDLSGAGRPTVDKHSTGGVGDKVSLALVPLVATFGAAVPQMAGRGLGHTGGTIDKMESIPGWRANLSAEEMVRGLGDIGGVICSASETLAPVDNRLYALRDVTGTVESIPLIASSIMSKKIAEGTASLLLDVKVGSGAFMPDVARARELAETMIRLGAAHDVKTRAMLTDMSTPIGAAVGNAVEVEEALDLLAGGGPEDLGRLVVEEARAMLELARIDADPAPALADGRAHRCFMQMVRAQGGDPGALPEGSVLATVRVPDDGYVTRLDARSVGVAAWRLGAGRARTGDPVSPIAGLRCLVKPGDRVRAGDPGLELVGEPEADLEGALAAVDGALEIGPHPPEPTDLILEVID